MAAAVGVVGGIAGALAGGCVAIQVQEDERRDARVDARRAIYSAFVGEGDALVAKAGLKLDALMPEGQIEPTPAQNAEAQDWLVDELAPFYRAGAALDLVVEDDEVMRVLKDIKRVDLLNEGNWAPLRERFVQAAREADGVE